MAFLKNGLLTGQGEIKTIEGANKGTEIKGIFKDGKRHGMVKCHLLDPSTDIHLVGEFENDVLKNGFEWGF